MSVQILRPAMKAEISPFMPSVNNVGRLIKSHIRPEITATSIATIFKWSPHWAKRLLKEGWCIPLDLVPVAKQIGKITSGISVDALVTEIGTSFRMDRDPVTMAIIKRAVEMQLSIRQVGYQLGVPNTTMTRLLSGGHFNKCPFADKLAQWLGMERKELLGQLATRYSRRKMPTITFDATPSEPLSEYILHACADEDVSITSWAKAHHLRDKTVRILANGGQVYLIQASIRRLAQILRLQEETVLAAMRRNRTYPEGAAPGLQHLLKTELARAGGIMRLSKQCGVRAEILSKIMGTGSIEGINPMIMYHLRQSLGMSLDEYRRTFKPTRSQTRTKVRTKLLSGAAVTADEDMVMLRLWNKASSAQREQALVALGGHPL